TDTIGWRMLARYGRIKYRYLLPFYRALRLPPYRELNDRTVDPRLGTGKNLESADSSAPLAPATRVSADLTTNTLDVVCFPIIDWDFRFQRPQQLMLQFAAA